MAYNSIPQHNNNISIKKLHFFIFCNTILDHCMKKYAKDCKTNHIPYDFITFYFLECQNSLISDDYLNTFFLCFNNNVVPLDNIIEVYSKSKLPVLKSKVITRDSLLRGLKAGKYLILDKISTKRGLQYNLDDEKIKSAVEQLISILTEINSSNNLIKTKYAMFLKQKQNPELAAQEVNKKVEEQNLHKHKALNTNKHAIVPPAQGKTEKITRLIIPRLRVLGMYPKSSTLSRVDSRYFAYHFTTPANEVRLVNIYHLKKIGLSTGFLEKRNQILESGNKKKSRFDDLF